VSRPVPCPGIATTWNRLWSKYGAITDGPQLENVQQQFRRDIEAFKKSNREHCGNKDNLDGYWVLSEDQLVDAIAYKNPALAAISGTALELQDDEYGRFQAAKAEPIVQSTVSFVISISAVYHRWELLYRMRQIKEIRRRVIDARRDGHGLSPTSAQAVLGTAWDDLVKKMGMPTAAIASSNRAIDILEQRIHTSQTALEALDQQSRRGYINSSIAVLGLGFLWMVALSMLSRIRDRKSVKRMNAERSVTKLCSILQDPLYSEMVRGHALHRIDFLGVSERSELDAIEKAVHMLLLRPLSTDRGLGIRAARLADVLGSRLRHRTIIDVPMEKQRRSMAMARSSQE